MSYTYDPADLSTALAKVRMAVGDVYDTYLAGNARRGVKPDGANYTDEELAIFLTKFSDDWEKTVPAVFLHLSGLYANESNVKVGAYSEEMGDRAEKLRQAASAWSQGLVAQTASYFDDGTDPTDITDVLDTEPWGEP